MSDPNIPGGPKKEFSMEQRLLLAFALMGVVLLVSQYVMPKPPVPDAKPAPRPPAAAQTADAPKPAPAKTEAEAPAGPASAEEVAGSGEQDVTVDTDLYHVVLSNRGGVVKSWLLKEHKDSAGKPLELVNQLAVAKTGYPFSVQFKDQSVADTLNGALFAAKQGADNLTVTFEYSKGGWYAKKTFEFKKKSYLSRFSSEVSQGGQAKPHLLAWRGGFGDESVIGAVANQHAVLYDLSQGKLRLLSAKDAKDGPVTNVGNYSFGGIQDAYFAAVALPEDSSALEVRTLSDSIVSPVDNKEQPTVGMSIGGQARNHWELFVGPKDTDVLRAVSPRLEQLIDWGWAWFIAKPLFQVLNWMNDRLVHNYGWAIVVTTILINFMLLPLKVSSLKSMKKMQVLQPQIASINDKYKGLSMRDPKKANQNQEIMDLYKKNGVNPAGGCVPMLLQLPFFIAYYKVLSTAIELRGAHWLWVTDLSRPETLPIRLLPVTMIATQFLMQRMTPNTTGDPSQQKVMMLMPLFLGFMFYSVSSGLVLYWLTGNLVGIAQQWFFNRTFNAPVTAAPVPAKKPRK